MSFTHKQALDTMYLILVIVNSISMNAHSNPSLIACQACSCFANSLFTLAITKLFVQGNGYGNSALISGLSVDKFFFKNNWTHIYFYKSEYAGGINKEVTSVLINKAVLRSKHRHWHMVTNFIKWLTWFLKKKKKKGQAALGGSTSQALFPIGRLDENIIFWR